MSEPATLRTVFLSWHNANGDVHIRTPGKLLHIPKTNPELVAKAKTIQRDTPIEVRGRLEYSKTLSTYVLALDQLDVPPSA